MLHGVGDIIVNNRPICSGSVSFFSQSSAFEARSFNNFGIANLSGAKINQKQYFASFELGANDWQDFQLAWGMTNSAKTITHKNSETFTVPANQEHQLTNFNNLFVYNETRGKTFTDFTNNNGLLIFPSETIGETFTAFYDSEIIVDSLVGTEDNYIKLSAKLYSAASKIGYLMVADRAIREKVSPLGFNGNAGLYTVTFRLVNGRANRKPFKLYELLPPVIEGPTDLIGLETESGLTLLTQNGIIIEAQLESSPLLAQDGQPLETQDGQIIRI